MGDIIFSTSMTEVEIMRVAKSFNIDYPSEAIDITPDYGLQYLLYHGKNFHYTTINDVGEKVVVGIEKIGSGEYIEAIPLIPESHLDRMITLFQDAKEGLPSFYGHAAEFAVRDALSSCGYHVFVPKNSNTAGWDLSVEEKFFSDNGLNYIENPDMPGYGLLQVKSTVGNNIADYTVNTQRHFEKYL